MSLFSLILHYPIWTAAMICLFKWLDHNSCQATTMVTQWLQHFTQTQFRKSTLCLQHFTKTNRTQSSQCTQENIPMHSNTVQKSNTMLATFYTKKTSFWLTSSICKNILFRRLRILSWISCNSIFSKSSTVSGPSMIQKLQKSMDTKLAYHSTHII